jgi:uncharacterized membrane protein
MRTRSILAALTLTAAILIGGTGTAAAQAQPLPNGRCLVDNLLDRIPILSNVVNGSTQATADPCDTIANNSGQLL